MLFHQMFFVPKSSVKDEKMAPNTQTRKVKTQWGYFPYHPMRIGRGSDVA